MRALGWMGVWALAACGPKAVPPVPATPPTLTEHCATQVGEPRVLEVVPGVWVAIGYDLANIVLIETAEGHVIVDAGMSPTRAAEARAALLAKAPGAVAHLVYTHSHIDHVGGATAWVEADTEVWATEAFTAHFFEQYSRFLPSEATRGGRQFGRHVSDAALACSSIGRRVDLDAALENGAVMPTRTFSGRTSIDHGGVRVELVEAHGETHDQLYVWLPESRVLLPGDNWYATFPNLYTIRGTSPRPVDDWIDSLDAMRAESPMALVPGHTVPVMGEEAVRAVLTDTRDAIQWVRDQTVRGANAGQSIDELAASVVLPPHLAERPHLQPLYGQLDWSARAIYGNELGWFDGEAADLYPLPPAELAARSVAAMGGEDAVRGAASEAVLADPRWALHLLGLLSAGAPLDAEAMGWRADALEAVAAEVANTNGRAYLLESALSARGLTRPLGEPSLSADFVSGMPIDMLMEVVAARLRVADALDVHETVHIVFSDIERTAHLTVRRGVLELAWDTPLPGTPAPVAVATTTTLTWKEVSLGMRSPLGALASGDLAIEGDLLAFRRFFDRFEEGVDTGQ